MKPGKATGQTAVKLKKRKSFDESVPGQRTLDTMLGAAPKAVGDFHAPVSKSRDPSKLARDHSRKDEYPRTSSLHPRNKQVLLKLSDIRTKVKDMSKASTTPQRVKEEQPKTPIMKREKAWPRVPHGSPPKRNKVIDLTQSPITKYISPTKRHPAPPDQPEKKHLRSPNTNGFVSITDASTKHFCVRSLASSPIIDLTVSSGSSPINLCSTSSSSFGSCTSTPKSSGLASPWERFSISASDISTSSSAQNSNSDDAKSDLPESEDFIPLDTPIKVAQLCQIRRERTVPVRLYTRANKIMPVPLEMGGSAVDQMDTSVPSLDTLKRELRLEFEQWSSSPEEDLRDLAAERMVCIERAPSPTPVEVVSLSGCHVIEYLETSLPFRVTLALQEALLLLSPSSRMPSAQVMAVICEKVILAEESTPLQRETGCSFLQQVLNQCPPGRSEVVRQVYADTFEQLGWLPQCWKVFGGTMQALIAVMIPSSPNLLVLRWMNNVLLSDLLSCTHSGSPASPMVSGLSAGLRHVLKATARAAGTRDESDPVAESLLEECLVTVQLYATHLLMRQGSIDSLAEKLSSELLEAGINHCSSSLNSIYPLQLRKAIMNQLTIKGVQ